MKLEFASDRVWVGRLQLGSAVAISLMLFANWWLMGDWEPAAADFAVFWKTAGQAEFYGGNFRFAYPPPAMLLLKPLAIFPFWPAYFAWIAISALLFFTAVKRLCGPAIGALSLLSGAALAGMLMGQISMLLSAGILFGFGIGSFWGGMILGAAAAVKPQLLVIAPLAFVVRRDWRMLGGSICGGMAMIAASLLVFGFSPWIEWARVLPAFHQVVIDTRVPAMTPTAIAESFGLRPLPWLLAGIMLAGGTIILTARRAEGAELAALVVGMGFLAVPYALPHDTIAVVPACVAYLLSRPGFKAFPVMAYFAAWGIALVTVMTAAHLMFHGLAKDHGPPRSVPPDP